MNRSDELPVFDAVRWEEGIPVVATGETESLADTCSTFWIRQNVAQGSRTTVSANESGRFGGKGRSAQLPTAQELREADQLNNEAFA